MRHVSLWLQVFVALLRACQQDSRRGLVRQALDVLTPALVRRLSGSDSRKPIWVRYVRKVLMEEGHSLSNMLHIWQLLVRHADLFYSSRSLPLTMHQIYASCGLLHDRKLPYTWCHASCYGLQVCSCLASCPCRVQFVSQMVNSLVKLGLPSNASLENRRLAIDLAGLVIYWEQRRLKGGLPPTESRKRTRDEAELPVRRPDILHKSCCTTRATVLGLGLF